MDFSRLPLANLARRPGRTALLASVAALLAAALTVGSLVLGGMRSGLASLGDRLGADLIVAPDEAKSKYDLEEVLVNGVPGSFYMDRSFVEKVAARDGVAQVSPQFFLASAKAGCCSVPLQIIGIDPATDFTIQPWIARSYRGTLGRKDVLTGANVTGEAGSTLKLYGVTCTIVGRLDETGTALDNAVFCDVRTIQDLIQGSADQGLAVLTSRDPAQVVSTIQVRVADGHSVTDVMNDIKLHVHGATAVQTRQMLSGVSDSMGGVSSVLSAVVAVVWVVAALVLLAAFGLGGRARAKEFAVLRVLGASRGMLARVVLVEALVVTCGGAVLGAGVAAVATCAFATALERALGLPFLLPGLGGALAWAALATFAAVACGTLASVASAVALSRVDPGQTLREE